MDIPLELEADLNRWYDEEHLAERMALPGFLRARRFVSVADGPKYVALYDLADGAMSGEAYVRALANPTEWTTRVISATTTFIRNEYELVQSIGDSPATPSPYLLMVCLETDDEHDAELNGWYNNEHLAALQSVPVCHTAKRYRATKLTAGFPGTWRSTSSMRPKFGPAMPGTKPPIRSGRCACASTSCLTVLARWGS